MAAHIVFVSAISPNKKVVRDSGAAAPPPHT
jgi:hypothetical protein